MSLRIIPAILVSMIMITIAWSAEREITINIYNGGFSQVTENREVNLTKNLTEIELHDIAEKIDPGSISIKGKNFDVRTIDYRFDLVSADRLLHKYIGKEISFKKDDSLYSGILLSFEKKYLFIAREGINGPVSVYERDDFKYVNLPSLPEGLITRPMICALVDPKKSGQQELELSYLTTGLGWQAEYHLIYDSNTKADLDGWVNLDNQCGISFPKASIVLVAGQVEREKPTAGSAEQFETGKMDVASKLKLEPLLDYHRYKLPFKTTLGEMETKQAVMFNVDEIKVDRFYKYQWSETKSDVKSIITFQNDNKSGLGFPLPPGRISIFDKKTNSFLGSGAFEGVPAGEKAEVFLGTAFDIKAERKRIEHKKISRNKNADTFEIKIRNHKNETIKIIIAEELYGYWNIIEKSDDYIKKDFQNIEFEVTIDAGAEKVITYTVEYSY